MNIEKQVPRSENEEEIYSQILWWDNEFLPNLYSTFKRSEELLLKEANSLLQNIRLEDEETQHSLYFDNSFQLILKPSIHTLRISHFIIIHSEFEQLWNILRPLFYKNINKDPTEFKFNDKIKEDSTDIIKITALEWDTLMSYNYLRNKIVHGKAKKCTELTMLQHNVASGNILGLEIKELKLKEKKEMVEFTLGKDFALCYEKHITQFLWTMFERVCANP